MQSLTAGNKGFPCTKHVLLMLPFPFELSHPLARHHSYFRMLRTARNISPAPWSCEPRPHAEERYRAIPRRWAGPIFSWYAYKFGPSSVINGPEGDSRVEQHSGLDLYLPKDVVPVLAAQAGCAGELVSIPGCATGASWSHCARDFIFYMTPFFDLGMLWK